MEIVQNLFRTLMFFLDNIIYGLIPQIYKLFIYLSQLNLFGGDDSNPLQRLINRVYVLLGIFMLFRVSFSLLQYIVDPSAFRDSSKGMGKLVTNVLVVLVLLVSVPSIFSFVADVQDRIVQSNVIGELILGSSMSDTGSTELSPERVETMAKDVQFMMFGAFYSLNPEVTSGDNALFSSCSGTSGVFGSRDMATKECLTQLDEEISDYDDASANGVDLYSFFKHTGSNERDGTPCIDGICDDRNFADFDKLLWWKSDGNYVINYLPFISTAAGIYVVFLLITFCVDVAVRVIKLCFLQMVAPIAIVSYIDPKESISNSKLSSWLKECATTYFSLFLRLATIFLVMLLISVISSMVLSENATVGQQVSEITGDDIVFNIWIYLFLIIGAFMFAKQVPKIIESIFGIKGSGEFSLNPLKNAGFAALAGGTVGLGVGAVASGAAAFSASRDEGAGNFTAFRRGIGGAFGGSVRGLYAGGSAGIQSGGKGMFSKSLDVAGIAGRNAALKTNTKLSQRIGAQARQAVGMQSKKEGLDKRIGYHNDLAKHVSAMKDRATDQLSKKSDKWKWTQQERANLQEAVKNKQDIRHTDKNGNVITASYNDQKAYQKVYADEMNRMFQDEQQMIREYINTGGLIQNGDTVIQHRGEDYQITIEHDAFVKEYNDNKLSYTDDKGQPLISKETGAPIVVDDDIQWDDIDKLGKAAEKEAAKLTNSGEYQDAEIIDQMQKSGIMQSHFGGNH